MTSGALHPTFPNATSEQRTAVQDRPWMPTQIFAMSFLFGSAAGGAVAAINARRLGQASNAAGYLILGVTVFLIQAAVALFAVPDESTRMVGVMFNVVCGLVLCRLQKPSFDAWKSAHWQPATEGERYKPNRIGALFLFGLLALAAEVGVIIGMLAAAGGL